MLLLSIFLLAPANLLTLAVSPRPAAKENLSFGEEGHIREFTMAEAQTNGTVPPGMVSHYLGNGVIAHVPSDAAHNITWLDEKTGKHISARSSNCEGLDCQGVYICEQEDFKGKCYWQQAGGGACHPYPYSRSSSFGVDMNLQCAFFSTPGCYDYYRYTDITWPGLGHGGLYGKYTWWNSRPQSYACRHCIGCIYGNAPFWF